MINEIKSENRNWEARLRLRIWREEKGRLRDVLFFQVWTFVLGMIRRGNWGPSCSLPLMHTLLTRNCLQVISATSSTLYLRRIVAAIALASVVANRAPIHTLGPPDTKGRRGERERKESEMGEDAQSKLRLEYSGLSGIPFWISLSSSSSY